MKSNYRSDVFLIALLGLTVQAFWALRLAHPSYMDAYYYATNGQRLAEGHGFTEMIIWQFLDESEGLPTPSHTYWMPLPSLLAAAGYRFIDHFRGAQLPFWLLAGSLPVLSFIISRQLAGERWQAWTAAMLTASGGFYNVFFNQPATFAPFAWAGGLCLLFQAFGSQRRVWYWWLLAGLTAGLAHLTRADGLLLLVVGILVGIRDWRLEIGDWRLNASPISNLQSLIFKAGPLLLGYFVIMGGWFIRNWLVLGRPLSAVGAQTIFLTTYDDLFAYGRSFDLANLATWGWDNVLYSRMTGISLALQTFVAVNCLIFLTPFVLWGWIALGRQPLKRPLLRPMTWYTLALFASMSLIFTFPGGRGGLFHSSAALWPWFMALAAGGIGLAVDWAAVRLSHWQPQRAKRIFAGLFVTVAFVLSFALGIMRTLDNSESAIYKEIGAALPSTAVVMVGNAPGFHYYTNLAAVSVPNEPINVVMEAAGRYGVTYLVLDEDHPHPLDDLYQGNIQLPLIRLIDSYGPVKLYHFTEIAR